MRVIQLFCIIIICLLHIPTAKANELMLYADEWCPYNCSPNTNYEGYLIDITRHIFEEEGYRVRYRILPWTRTLLLAQNNENVVAVGTYAGDGTNLIFPEEEAGYSVMTFLVNRHSNWKYSSISDLEDIKLGVIKGYSYGEPLDSYIQNKPENIHFLHGDSPLAQGLKMLQSNRIDAFIDDKFVLQEGIKQIGQLNDFRFAGALPQGNKVYLSFSPSGKSGAKYAQIFSEGLIQLRENGKLQKLLNKYGVNDWKN